MEYRVGDTEVGGQGDGDGERRVEMGREKGEGVSPSKMTGWIRLWLPLVVMLRLLLKLISCPPHRSMP